MRHMLLASAGIGLWGIFAAAVLFPRTEHSATAATLIEMRNVHYDYDSTLAVHIRRLRGTLLPQRSGVPPTFDDKGSFAIQIESAEIGAAADALTTLISRSLAAKGGSPIKSLKIAVEPEYLKITGTVHEAIDVPFEMHGAVSAMPGGRLRLHPMDFKVAHVPAKKLLHLLGVHIGKLVTHSSGSGVSAEHDDLILDLAQLLPPPRMQGNITQVKMEGGELVQLFGAPKPADPALGNYIKFTGGVIRFGKLTMQKADLALIDAEPKDWFEFSLDRYKDQLVAGYSKTTPSFGLRVYMPDVTKIKTESRR